MKRIIQVLAIAMVMVSCTMKEEIKNYPFYIGTYTDGTSEGIYKGVLHADGTMDSLTLVAQTNNPSFLSFANNKQFLLAVGEVDIEGTGTIESYRINQEGLQHISTSISGGAHPCHLSVNTKGDVLMANYSGGNIGLVKMDNEGELSDLQFAAQHEGSGLTNRQTAPHAHSIWFMDEKNAVAVDLGIDQLIFYQLSEQQLLKTDSLVLEAGAGPRHLAMHPAKEILYVINELNSTVSIVAKHNDSWQIQSSVSTLPEGFIDENYCADIHISKDGRFLYASNRGHNSLAIYQVEAEGKKLKLITHESVQGAWPRNFSLTADDAFLIVANQHTNNLIAFDRDKNTGLLNRVGEVAAPSPVCILFE